ALAPHSITAGVTDITPLLEQARNVDNTDITRLLEQARNVGVIDITRLFQQARDVDNTDSYAVRGLGEGGEGGREYP
ncbi:hypothetical protein PSZ55_23875, partial [Shigella sonnei]|nr:hypothetical protein [Shigella sonnei]